MGPYGRQREQTGTTPFPQASRRLKRRIGGYLVLTLTNRYDRSGRLPRRRRNSSLQTRDFIERSGSAVMTDTPKARAARLPHLRRAALAKGDPVPLPITLASIFHLPGDPAGA